MTDDPRNATGAAAPSHCALGATKKYLGAKLRHRGWRRALDWRPDLGAEPTRPRDPRDLGATDRSSPGETDEPGTQIFGP